VLDQKLIRENPTSVEEGLSLRGKVFNISQIHELTLQKKEIDIKISSLQSESKKLSKLIGQEISKSKNNDSPEVNNLKKKGNEYRTKISEFEEEKRTLDKNIHNEICNLPNLPSKDAPIGKDESHNVQIKTWGDPLVKENLKSHWEIGESLNLFDSVKSTKVSKSRFITLIGNGARLERALINFMLDMHTSNGYLELMPPALVNSESLTGSGQLPKFSNESFKCSNDDLWLSPTAEVPLTAFHRNEIIDYSIEDIDPKVIHLIKNSSEDFSTGYGNSHKKVIRSFMDSLSLNQKFSIDILDTLNTTKLVHALYRSSEKSMLVDVNNDDSMRLGK